jgi:hypothetical protein
MYLISSSCLPLLLNALVQQGRYEILNESERFKRNHVTIGCRRIDVHNLQWPRFYDHFEVNDVISSLA